LPLQKVILLFLARCATTPRPRARVSWMAAGEPALHQLSKATVSRICAGQVITDVVTALKELLEYVWRNTPREMEQLANRSADKQGMRSMLARVTCRSS